MQAILVCDESQQLMVCSLWRRSGDLTSLLPFEILASITRNPVASQPISQFPANNDVKTHRTTSFHTLNAAQQGGVSTCLSEVIRTLEPQP